MLPFSNKNSEELETRLDFIHNKQIELEVALESARTHLTTIVQGEINNFEVTVTQNLETQSKWIATRISASCNGILEQSELGKSENVAVIAALETRLNRQNDVLRAQLAEVVRVAQANNAELSRRLDEMENAARDRAELEIDDVSPRAIQGWSETVGARLKRFGDAQGMPRSFAWQLLQELKELTDLNRQLGANASDWETRLDELQRVLFADDRVMPWTCLTPHNSSETQRRELRDLETAVAQMRSYVQENLLNMTGIRPLEIVPRISPFDASVHESNEFLEVPTGEASRHNLILSVEQSGFQKISSLGDAKLLRPARVRRYVLQSESAPPAVINEFARQHETEPLPVEIVADEGAPPDEAPRVSGQL